MTETHLVLGAGLFGNFNPLHEPGQDGVEVANADAALLVENRRG